MAHSLHILRYYFPNLRPLLPYCPGLPLKKRRASNSSLIQVIQDDWPTDLQLGEIHHTHGGTPRQMFLCSPLKELVNLITYHRTFVSESLS